jgi:hypothetical protein
MTGQHRGSYRPRPIEIIGLVTVVIALPSLLFLSDELTSSATPLDTTLNELQQGIERLDQFERDTAVRYEPGLDQYRLELSGAGIQLHHPTHGTAQAPLPGVNVSPATVTDSRSICIANDDGQIYLHPGNCTSIDATTACADGRCINDICQPGLGETCRTTDCGCSDSQYPDSNAAARASRICQPDYQPGSYMKAKTGEQDGTVSPLGCVDTDFVNTQEETDQCTKDFECSGDLTCTPAAGKDSTSSNCCPEGMNYDPSTGTCRYQDRLKLVFVPINRATTTGFRTYVDTTVLPNWLNDLPVSRDEIQVEIIDPDVVDRDWWAPYFELDDQTVREQAARWDIDTANRTDKELRRQVRLKLAHKDIGTAKLVASKHRPNVNPDHIIGIYGRTPEFGLGECGNWDCTGDQCELTFLPSGSVASPANRNQVLGWGLPGQEIAHNWGFNHILPYAQDMNDTSCDAPRKYSASYSPNDYMQNQDPLTDYKPQEQHCIREVFIDQGWINDPEYTPPNSSIACDRHLVGDIK